ncbi:MAG: SixA phosphatase family protein, partial [Methylophilaceae bacterium]
MKKIHLLRHAKSDWENKTHADIDRPINERGVRTAIFMASQLQNAGYAFVHVYCSPAVRAQSTIELISEHLLEIDFQWQVDNALYTFDSHRLHEWFRLLDESID